MWKWLRIAAILAIAFDFFTPDLGLINASAQAVVPCEIYGTSGGNPYSGHRLLGTETDDQVKISGGCIDGVTIGSKVAVTVNGEAANFTRASFIMSGFGGL